MHSMHNDDKKLYNHLIIYKMYKFNNKIRLEKSRQPAHWLKRKIMLIITAFMIGMSNGMNTGENIILKNQNHTEQHKKD